MPETTSGHGGAHVVAAARAHGASTMFTLSGGHIFPIYDGAVHADPPLRMIDVRAEHTAVFAAEATGKLTRSPGLAVVTAGPGVTNAVSPIHAGVLRRFAAGGARRASRDRAARTCRNSTTSAAGVGHQARRDRRVDRDHCGGGRRRFPAAATAHRGPVFLDFPIDQLFTPADAPTPPPSAPVVTEPDPDAVAAVAGLLARARRPVLVLGSDVWLDGAEEAALRFVDGTGIRGRDERHGPRCGPRRPSCAGDEGALGSFRPLRSRRRGRRTARLPARVWRVRADATARRPPPVADLADSPAQVAHHVDLARVGSRHSHTGLRRRPRRTHRAAGLSSWREDLRSRVAAAVAGRRRRVGRGRGPDPPARIYGELLPRLAEDAVVIGDGGDFVSFAGKYVEPRRPGGWLDPGPYCASGRDSARRSPPGWPTRRRRSSCCSATVRRDVAAGCGHPCTAPAAGGDGAREQPVLGTGEAPDAVPLRLRRSAPTCARDALRRGRRRARRRGETVTRSERIGPALDRAFAAGVPYLVNVRLDPRSPTRALPPGSEPASRRGARAGPRPRSRRRARPSSACTRRAAFGKPRLGEDTTDRRTHLPRRGMSPCRAAVRRPCARFGPRSPPSPRWCPPARSGRRAPTPA